ncbi:hypothetical protein [Candidatus Methylopumilus planktonicus]|uniref:hypothetical protein n=1 Tax=Candidatus Methylopumilus planktonicus TaxID=1581557 RepID=UPI003BEF2E57
MNTKTIYILLLSVFLLIACDRATDSSQNRNSNQNNNFQKNKSSEQEIKTNDLNFKNKDELTAAFNKMKDSWEKEFAILNEACGGVFPSVKNYGLFMTEEQILLSSLMNNDGLTCVNYEKAELIVTERRCSSPAFSKPIKEIFLGKISENGPFRAFQIEVGFGDDLNSGEEEVLFKNFKVNFKSDDDFKMCRTKSKFQIEKIEFIDEVIGSIEFDFGRLGLSFGPMKNYVTIFSSEYSDLSRGYKRSIYDKKYEAEKSAAEKNTNLKKF